MFLTTVIPNACHVDGIAVTTLSHSSRSLGGLCWKILLLRSRFRLHRTLLRSLTRAIHALLPHALQSRRSLATLTGSTFGRTGAYDSGMAYATSFRTLRRFCTNALITCAAIGAVLSPCSPD